MLRPKKHITRQKIKEDKFVTETLRAVEWMKRNQNKLIAGGAVAIIVAFVIWGSLSARQAAEREASLLTLRGGYELEQGSLDEARIHLLEAVERFGGTPSAGRATFMLGHIFFRQGATDSARGYFQQYLDRYAKQELLRAAAVAGIAACMEQQGDYPGAARTYEQAARDYKDHPKAAHYLLQAGRSYQLAGQIQQAIAVYERIKQDYPDMAEADRAAIEMAQLAHQGG